MSFESETTLSFERNEDSEDVKALVDEEFFEEFANGSSEDPLRNAECEGIIWEYSECDILEDEHDDRVHRAPPPSRAKRGRFCTEFKARNGMRWIRTAPETTLTRSSSDIVNGGLLKQPKVKGPAQHVSNPLEAWNLLLEQPILADIVKQTNKEIHKRKGMTASERPTDLIELRAWIGLNYLCGIFRNSPHGGPLEELWTVELGNAIFRATMSAKRFEFISECLRLGEQNSKSNKIEFAASAGLMWEKFIVNCRSYYAPSSNCTIDEHIIRITDPECPSSCSLPQNLSASGLRLVTLCDLMTLYVCNAIIATDATPSEAEILHLVADIKGTQRNVCVTERYTSVQLANKMLSVQLNLIGPLPVNSKEFPPDLLHAKSQPQQVCSAGLRLTCGVQTEEFILDSGGVSRTINTGKLHLAAGRCCQRLEQQAKMYSTEYATPAPSTVCRWTLEFFHAMLNYAALNARTLLRLSHNGDATLTQRDFQRKLGLYLTHQQLKRRLQRHSKLSLAQKLLISEILDESTEKILNNAQTLSTQGMSIGTIPHGQDLLKEGVTLMPKILEKRARCRICPSKNSMKTRTRCQQCLSPQCNKHLISRCATCTGVKSPQQNIDYTEKDFSS